jgi:hypothetical protein
MLPNCCHKAVQDAGEYYPAAALHKYHVLLQPTKISPTKTNSTETYPSYISIIQDVLRDFEGSKPYLRAR